MKRKRRIWIATSAALLISAIGVFFYFSTRENPDYVRAAKLLPEMRQKAREAFGPLTWEEFREEEGTVFQDDSQEWKRIGSSIPQVVAEFRLLDPPEPERFGELFEQNRAWFLGLSTQTDTVVLQHLDPGIGFSDFLFPIKSFINALTTGIVGAADLGDVEAVEEIVRTGFSILEKIKEETDQMSVVQISSNSNRIVSALLTAVARNTDDEQLISVAIQLIEESPTMPDIREAMAGEARSNNAIFEIIRDEEQGTLNEMLDTVSMDLDLDSAPLGPSSPSLADKVREFFAGLLGESKNSRRTGEHTLDALESRFWEVQLDHLSLGERVLSELPYRLEALERSDDELQGKTDLSYEVAQAFLYRPEARLWTNHEIVKGLSLLALTVMAEYPETDSLPTSLPVEFLHRDPYGEGKVLYKKTDTGFIVYSRYLDGVDGGFVPRDTLALHRDNAVVLFSNDREDFGIVVNYELPVRAPIQ